MIFKMSFLRKSMRLMYVQELHLLTFQPPWMLAPSSSIRWGKSRLTLPTKSTNGSSTRRLRQQQQLLIRKTVAMELSLLERNGQSRLTGTPRMAKCSSRTSLKLRIRFLLSSKWTIDGWRMYMYIQHCTLLFHLYLTYDTHIKSLQFDI